jgi:hypothetical protein
MSQDKASVCVIDTDLKSAESIRTATEKIRQDLNLSYLHKSTLAELNEFLSQPETKDTAISLLILCTEDIHPLTLDELEKIKIKYKTNLILTAFDDSLKPLKKTDTWPIENIIYKPFDPAILQEHLQFALIKGEKNKTTAVHTTTEKNNIEKIRRQNFLHITDFGFSIESTFEYTLNHPYKFYHLSFFDKKKASQWVKAISRNNNTYEFIFCVPTHAIVAHLREKTSASNAKLKNVKWQGFEKNKIKNAPLVFLQKNDPDDLARLKDYFARKFPSAKIIDLPEGKSTEKIKCDLIISEIEFSPEQLNGLFEESPLYFRLCNDGLGERSEAEKILSSETVRLSQPVDRNFLGRMMNSYFPGCVETEPNPTHWITLADPALHSEMIEANELSEVAFIYMNDTMLTVGEFQEFALTQEDETELRPIKAKVQFVDTKPDAEHKYLHQVVFFGVRDDLLKRIRLWMLQTFINHKKSDS